MHSVVPLGTGLLCVEHSQRYPLDYFRRPAGYFALVLKKRLVYKLALFLSPLINPTYALHRHQTARS
jgi:hypothetical protein